MENVRCNFCGAYCQYSEIETVEYMVSLFSPLRVMYPWIGILHLYLCPFCVIDPNTPIPYTLTEKGFKPSISHDEVGDHEA